MLKYISVFICSRVKRRQECPVSLRSDSLPAFPARVARSTQVMVFGESFMFPLALSSIISSPEKYFRQFTAATGAKALSQFKIIHDAILHACG
jgi:hypothetical protein